LTAKEPSGSALTSGATAVVNDYGLFRPLDYLLEYHSNWDAEDDFSSKFIHESFQIIGPQESMIDVGGGPTIYQLISARNKVKTIMCAEYLESNRQAVDKWRRSEPDAFNWDTYFRHYQKLESDIAPEATIEEMKANLRSKITEFVLCDLNDIKTIPDPTRRFDIVSSHYCIEAICQNDDDLVSKMSKLINLMRPNGYLIMSSLKDAKCYQVGDFNFYAYPINQDRSLEVIEQLGCKLLKVETGPAAHDRNYGGTFSVLAQRTG